MTELNKAEESFWDSLIVDQEKLASLQPQTMDALGVEDPTGLEVLEEQAAQVVVETEPAPDVEEVQSEPEAPLEPPPEVEIQAPSGVFTDRDTHPLHLATLLKAQYNDDWVGWLPETLWEIIRKDFTPISDVNKNKIQALSVSLSTDTPWMDWHIFENVGKSFNGIIPHFGVMHPLSPAEAAFTLSVLDRLHDFEPSPEVQGYIASCCLYYGLILLPKEWFGDIQELVDKQNQNLDIKKEVKLAWNKVKKQDLSEIEFSEDTPIDVQVKHLSDVKEYLLIKETQLKET